MAKRSANMAKKRGISRKRCLTPLIFPLTKIDYKPPRGGRKRLREVNTPESVLEKIRIPNLAPITLSISQEQINRTTQVSTLVLATVVLMGMAMQSTKMSMQNI